MKSKARVLTSKGNHAMNGITEYDLLLYAEGAISDPDELERIEVALDSDSSLAGQLDEIQSARVPAPDLLADSRETFRRLHASVWGRLEWSAATGTKSGSSTLHLPNGESIPVQIELSGNKEATKVKLTISKPVPGWRAANITLFHPRGPTGQSLEISHPQNVTRQPQRDQEDARLSPQVWDAAAETYEAAASKDRPTGWQSSVAEDPAGGQAWLDDSNGLMLNVRYPESAVLVEQVRYRLEWQGPQEADCSEAGAARLESGSGLRYARIPLRLSAKMLQKAPQWRLVVQPIHAPGQTILNAGDFRQVAGDDFQVLILNQVEDEGDRHPLALEAGFWTERERTLWNDPTVGCWVRFEQE
jgi:hypothetical protein